MNRNHVYTSGLLKSTVLMKFKNYYYLSNPNFIQKKLKITDENDQKWLEY